jgi:hypothetical protein
MDEVLRIRLETLGADDPLTLESLRDGVKIAVKLGRWAEVETLGRECYEAHARVLGPSDPNTVKCQRRMVEAYEEHGDEALAEAWR